MESKTRFLRTPEITPVDASISHFNRSHKTRIFGYTNHRGPKITASIPIQEGMGVITVDDHYGYIDVTGKLVIPPVFVFAYLFSDSLALLSRDWIHHQYITRLGKSLLL